MLCSFSLPATWLGVATELSFTAPLHLGPRLPVGAHTPPSPQAGSVLCAREAAMAGWRAVLASPHFPAHHGPSRSPAWCDVRDKVLAGPTPPACPLVPTRGGEASFEASTVEQKLQNENREMDKGCQLFLSCKGVVRKSQSCPLLPGFGRHRGAG